VVITVAWVVRYGGCSNLMWNVVVRALGQWLWVSDTMGSGNWDQVLWVVAAGVRHWSDGCQALNVVAWMAGTMGSGWQVLG
jgi:hypothetical protein